MDAVVFNGPFKIDVERRPVPVLETATDAVVKVILAGICGSELHMYRGHQDTKPGHIMGHEFVGIVESLGNEVKHLSVGQKVVCTFSAICMNCWFCKHGYTNRCVHGAAFGTQALAGGQAEYVRVPFADGTLQPVPAGLEEGLLMMMCDILPTGYYGTSRAISGFLQQAQFDGEDSCGPVGLCAILTAKSKGVGTVYAVDSVDDRLDEARHFGGIPLKLGQDEIEQIVREATDGRGADAVIEVVGNKAALRSAFDLLRPCGVLSSLGFHQGELPFSALEAYQKNLNINLGRAPVRTVYKEALEVLTDNQSRLSSFISHTFPLEEAANAFEMFEKRQARKILLRP